MFLGNKESKWFFRPNQDAFVPSLNKLQEAIELFEQPFVICSAIDEIRLKQHFSETSEVDKKKRAHYPHH